MSVDAGGRAQHRDFGGDATPAQGIEVRLGCTEAGHGDEVVAQREQAAQERAGGSADLLACAWFLLQQEVA